LRKKKLQDQSPLKQGDKMYWNTISSLLLKDRLWRQQPTVTRQIAPPKPSFVKEPDISDMMPEWLKERKKAEEENRKAFEKWNSGSISDNREKKSHENSAASNDITASVTKHAEQTVPQDQTTENTAATAPKQLDLFGEKLLDPASRLKHKLIGQLFDTYWLIEYNDHLYIIDQHAAHEKVPL